MTKDEIISYFKEWLELADKQHELNEKTSGMFVGLNDTRSIHIDERDFQHVADQLQPTIIYNPAWNNSYSLYGEEYFYTEIDGKRIKVFALWTKAKEAE